MAKKSLKDVYQCLQPKKLDKNYQALSMTGEFLFTSDKNKADWYVRKNLAVWVSDDTYQLNFKTKGNGNAKYGEYFTEFHEVQCSICGVTDNLTKHHIIPRCFRTHFPEKMKSTCHFDVLLICVDCHETVERRYDQVKLELEMGKSPFSPPLDLNYCCFILGSKAKYFKNCKQDDAKYLIKAINALEGKDYIDIKDIIKDYRDEHKRSDECLEEIYKLVSQNQPDMKQFILMWRQLFIDASHPRFLPKGWLELYKTHFKWENENG
jgi:hypothetical protein